MKSSRLSDILSRPLLLGLRETCFCYSETETRTEVVQGAGFYQSPIDLRSWRVPHSSRKLRTPHPDMCVSLLSPSPCPSNLLAPVHEGDQDLLLITHPYRLRELSTTSLSQGNFSSLSQSLFNYIISNSFYIVKSFLWRGGPYCRPPLIPAGLCGLFQPLSITQTILSQISLRMSSLFLSHRYFI